MTQKNMLSSKQVKVHGISSRKWTIRDKLAQYRGILKLHERDKKLQVINAGKLKRKVSRDLVTLRNDVRAYHGIVNDVIHGDKRRLYNALQQHKDIQRTLQNLPPLEVYDFVYQDNHAKRKKLDKMQYEKKKKVEEFVNLKLERSFLAEEIKDEREYKADYAQQRLITQYQQSMSQHNSAKSIQVTYRAMLDMLKKDAVYFDAVLHTLQIDRKDQGKIIFRATVMGQLATENLDDVRQKYKRMAREVLVNMKERERTLEVVREQVKDLWEYAQSLVRIESETDLTKRSKAGKHTDVSLESQIRNLEEMFEKVKASLLVKSYEEVFSRLEEQANQKKRLATQFNHNINERKSLLSKVHHAELVLASLDHSTISTTGQYKTHKKEMLEKIEIQMKRVSDLKKLSKSRGELLLDIRAALQNILSMLVFIKPGKSGKRAREGKATRYVEERQNVDDEKAEETSALHLEKMETDGLALLSQISRKIGVLCAMNNFTLDKEKEEKAKDLYQSYVSDYMSKLKFPRDTSETNGIFDEPEMVDSTVPTRADIKLRSKQIIDANLKID